MVPLQLRAYTHIDRHASYVYVIWTREIVRTAKHSAFVPLRVMKWGLN
jgi:hypothetical protein